MIVWLLFLLFLAYALWRLFGGYPARRIPTHVLASREVAFLDACAEAMFPPGGAIPLSGVEADLPRYTDDWLSELPAGLRLQIRALLMLFEQVTIFLPAPAPWGRRRFSALSESQRVEVLRRWSESQVYGRRLLFTALRAVLTMGYLGHPKAMRALGVAPWDFPRPVVEADLLVPRAGAHPDTIAFTEGDLAPPSGIPLPLDTPLHPAYREDPA